MLGRRRPFAKPELGKTLSMNLSISSDTISSLGRAAHDVGVGALIGGNLFARVGMHPAMSEISNPRERGQAVNEAWRRYGTVNALALGSIVTGWAGARMDEASNSMLSPRERPLAAAKDAAVAATAITGIAAGLAGMSFAGMEPEGAVPLNDGDTAAPEATDSERRMKRFLNAVGSLNLASAVALASVNAALSQTNFRRPPARRFLRKRY
jgi:hypothetical protein